MFPMERLNIDKQPSPNDFKLTLAVFLIRFAGETHPSATIALVIAAFFDAQAGWHGEREETKQRVFRVRFPVRGEEAGVRHNRPRPIHPRLRDRLLPPVQLSGDRPVSSIVGSLAFASQ